MPITLTAPRSELSRVVADELAASRRSPDADGAELLVNLSLQAPNTLLHDGHAWKRRGAARILSDTRAMLADADGRGADFIVHASYAFLRATEAGERVGGRLAPIVAAAREAERMVLGGKRPACVVRLGYLYGPGSRDLGAYRTAFRIGRPYWAGPRSHLQHHLHTTDAARAVLLAARRRPRGRLLYATDEEPASFASFGDRFARLVGNPLPIHLPRLSRHVAHAVVAEEHMQMVDLAVNGPAAPPLPHFRPAFADYRAGLDEVIATWKR